MKNLTIFERDLNAKMRGTETLCLYAVPRESGGYTEFRRGNQLDGAEVIQRAGARSIRASDRHSSTVVSFADEDFPIGAIEKELTWDIRGSEKTYDGARYFLVTAPDEGKWDRLDGRSVRRGGEFTDEITLLDGTAITIGPDGETRRKGVR